MVLGDLICSVGTLTVLCVQILFKLENNGFRCPSENGT